MKFSARSGVLGTGGMAKGVFMCSIPLAQRRVAFLSLPYELVGAVLGCFASAAKLTKQLEWRTSQVDVRSLALSVLVCPLY